MRHPPASAHKTGRSSRPVGYTTSAGATQPFQTHRASAGHFPNRTATGTSHLQRGTCAHTSTGQLTVPDNSGMGERDRTRVEADDAEPTPIFDACARQWRPSRRRLVDPDPEYDADDRDQDAGGKRAAQGVSQTAGNPTPGRRSREPRRRRKRCCGDRRLRVGGRSDYFCNYCTQRRASGRVAGVVAEPQQYRPRTTGSRGCRVDAACVAADCPGEVLQLPTPKGSVGAHSISVELQVVPSWRVRPQQHDEPGAPSCGYQQPGPRCQ